MSNKLVNYLNDSFIIGETEYSAEEFYQLWIEQRVTAQDLSQKYNVSSSTIHNIASHYGYTKGISLLSEITDDGFVIRGKKYPKEWIYTNYVRADATSKDAAKKLGIQVNLFFDILRHYNIRKDRVLSYEGDTIFYKDKSFTKDDVVALYIDEELSQEKVAAKLQIPEKTVAAILSFYGIKKTTEQNTSARKKTVKEKYGNEYLLQNKELCEKRKETCLKNWGNTNPMSSEKWQEQFCAKTGVKKWQLVHIQHYDIWGDDDKFIDFLSEKKRTAYEIGQFFNVDPSTVLVRAAELDVRELLKAQGGFSHYEDEICEMLINDIGIPKAEIKKHVRSGIFDDKREIDIYLPKYKVGIEFNGNYFHSDLQEKNSDHNGRSRYHQKKSLDALQKGVFIFHIFEYEWNNLTEKEKIKNRLSSILIKNKRKIAGRKCEVKYITKEQKKVFLDDNHIQGNDHCSQQIGLFLEEELVACMTFVKPKSRKYTWELSRFCSKKGTTVQGGASKLLQFFTRTLQPGDTISSYNDITKTSGHIYEVLGFKCTSVNPPNYIWMNFQTNDIRTRYQEQKGGEVERMHALGYHRICDCGTKTWVYTVEG